MMPLVSHSAVFMLVFVTIQAQNEVCFKFMDCLPQAIMEAVKTGDLDTICRLGPAAVECAEEANAQCEDENMKRAANAQITNLKAGLSQCEDDMKECVETFGKCYTPELQQASEHQDTESLCRVGPSVLQCMDNVMTTQCKGREKNPNVKKLMERLDTIKSKVKEMCNIDDENHGNSLLASILHTCLAAAFIFLIHQF